MAFSFKVQVVADGSGRWIDNLQRFETEKEANEAAFDLSMRWTSVRDTQVVECTDPVNYRWDYTRRKAVHIGSYQIGRNPVSS